MARLISEAVSTSRAIPEPCLDPLTHELVLGRAHRHRGRHSARARVAIRLAAYRVGTWKSSATSSQAEGSRIDRDVGADRHIGTRNSLRASIDEACRPYCQRPPGICRRACRLEAPRSPKEKTQRCCGSQRTATRQANQLGICQIRCVLIQHVSWARRPADLAKPLSNDLRERAVAAILKGGLSRHRAAAQFG